MILKDLNYKLNEIKELWNINRTARISAKNSYIKKYYKVNRISYNLFHNNSGFLHMGISKGKKYDKNDLLASPRIIEKEINKKTKNILELACGRGANSIYLAKKYKEINFFGLDLSEAQFKNLKNKIKNISNFQPSIGDYHNLNKFRGKNIDIVFVIEALCHSTRKNKVLEEVYNILKKGGKFIVIDGYSCEKNLSKEEKISLNLVEKGMAVEKFEKYFKFIKQAKKKGFKIKKEEDKSINILPTLMRFEKLSKIFFKNKNLARFIYKIFPKEFTNNVLAGYLLPNLIKDKVVCYKVTILEK